MRKRFWILVVAAIALCGCVAIRPALYGRTKYPPVDPKEVQVFKALPPDLDSYEVIGELSVQASIGDYDSLFYARLKRRVGEVGGDAVVLRRQHEGTHSILIAPAKTSSVTTDSAVATGSINGHNIEVSGRGKSETTTVYMPENVAMFESASGNGLIIRYKKR